MVLEVIMLVGAAGLVAAAMHLDREWPLFIAIAAYAGLALWLAFHSTWLLMPAVLLAIGLEVLGLSRMLRREMGPEDSASGNRHRPA